MLSLNEKSSKVRIKMIKLRKKTYENIFPIYPRYLIEYIAAVAGMKGEIIEYPDLFI